MAFPKKRGIRGVLWDYDDTLAPTEIIALGTAYRYMVEELRTLRRVSVKHTEAEHVDRFAGTTFREILTQLGPELNFELTDPEMDRLVETEVERVLAALGTELKPMQGSLQIMQRCVDLEINSSVVSSSATRRLHACLDCTGQNQFVPRDRVFSASDSMAESRSKPDPAIYNFALQQLDLRPSDVLAVEDSLSGTKSAVAAGIQCLGFTGALDNGKKALRREQLLEVGAIEVVDDLLEVEKFLF